MSERKLPEGWVETTLGTVSVVVMGQSPESSTYNENRHGIPFFQGKAEFGVKSPTVRKWCTSPTKIASTHSILMSVRAPVGPINIADQECCIGRGLCAISSNQASYQDFLAHFLRERGPWLSEQGTGTTFKAISGDFIRELEVPLPPLLEQKRIVAKLDSLLGMLDECQTRLDRVPALLKRFRQSVLAAATSGRLTEDWRVEKGISTPWIPKTIRDVGKVQLGRQRSPRFHNGDRMMPYLRVQNVFEDRLDLSDVMTMDFPGEDLERYRLIPGDILLNEGQSPQYLGRPTMYRGELGEVCFTNTLIRFQAGPGLLSEYALLVFRHYMHCGIFQGEGTITTNIAHLGAGRFASLNFLLPSEDEQAEIIRQSKGLFALADRIEARYVAAKAKVERLQPALLAKAFRGDLVAQDPNDEPASMLLERVKAKTEADLPRARRGRQAR